MSLQISQHVLFSIYMNTFLASHHVYSNNTCTCIYMYMNDYRVDALCGCNQGFRNFLDVAAIAHTFGSVYVVDRKTCILHVVDRKTYALSPSLPPSPSSFSIVSSLPLCLPLTLPLSLPPSFSLLFPPSLSLTHPALHPTTPTPLQLDGLP